MLLLRDFSLRNLLINVLVKGFFSGIHRKRGLPFLLNRYRKRKIFAIALVIIIVAIIAVSNFIWNIEIRRS